jgi:hypothetical protein
VRASSADLITHDESDQSGMIPPVPTQLTELPMWQSASEVPDRLRPISGRFNGGKLCR